MTIKRKSKVMILNEEVHRLIHESRFPIASIDS
jgi:hypothetical protein